MTHPRNTYPLDACCSVALPGVKRNPIQHLGHLTDACSLCLHFPGARFMLLLSYNERFFLGGSLFLFVLIRPRRSPCRDSSSDTAAPTLQGVWVPAREGHRAGGGHARDGTGEQSLRPGPHTPLPLGAPHMPPIGAPAELGQGCIQEARRRDSALRPRTRGLANRGRDATHQEKVV